jgi:ferredoxin-type protein NapH
MRRVVIIGNGITGVTAARHLRKRGRDEIVVVSAETRRFYSRTALMYVYMGHMTLEDTRPYEEGFWEKNRIRLVQDRVERVDTRARRLLLRGGDALSYEALVIASGSKSNRFGWPGQDLPGVQGFVGFQDLEELERNTRGIRRAVVVGGGLIGIEMAEMLLSRGAAVTFLVRERNFWNIVLPEQEARMIERRIREHGVDLRLETELREVLPGENGRVRAVVTGRGEEIPCGFVGLAVGVSPNIGFLEGSGVETDRGVLVNAFFETGVPGVWAGGDCAQFREPLPGRRPVEQVWYTGRMHGEQIAANVAGERGPYRPGVWFNSAKFFDLEFQTYGSVPSELPGDQETLYWEDPDGRRSIRINFHTQDRSVTGFNLLGIRGRHRVCERWIQGAHRIEEVVEQLGSLNFDPEFFRPFEQEVREAFRQRAAGSQTAREAEEGLFCQDPARETVDPGGAVSGRGPEPGNGSDSRRCRCRERPKDGTGMPGVVRSGNTRGSRPGLFGPAGSIGTAGMDRVQKAGLGLLAAGFLALLIAWAGAGSAASLLMLLLCAGGIGAGSVAYIWQTQRKAPAGVKNDGVMVSGLTARGVLGWSLAAVFIGFYVVLYWFPAGLVHLVRMLDPLSRALRGTPADSWFLYGTFYSAAVLLMGLRMLLKYRHNRYQIVRTASVIFFQLVLAFLIPSLMVRLHQPEYYFSYFWPLKYNALFPSEWQGLGSHPGGLGLYLFAWGAGMTFVATPVLTYFFGKRWYCSWVCGCGGLANTLGDPWRHLSDKSLRAWKIERYSIYAVLGFVTATTVLLWLNSCSGGEVLGTLSGVFARTYGFLIGAVFAGVVGVGFYPVLGTRVWCRFGCPMAAALGVLQKKISRFRITTNGGQCISCGYCSTYCEMGIDVRWYAQQGQDIVRASCVGCGICSLVCPRGVLNLENGPRSTRQA